MEKDDINKVLEDLNPNQKLVLLLAKEIINDINDKVKCENIDLVIDMWWYFAPNLGDVNKFEILNEMAKKKIKIIDDFKPDVENSK